MLSNADVTFYSFADYSRHVVTGVYYCDERGKNTTRRGETVNDNVTVFLYTDAYIPNPGDVLVKGAVDFTFTATTQETISASMQAFRTTYPGFAVVENVADRRFGGLPHIEITAR